MTSKKAKSNKKPNSKQNSAKETKSAPAKAGSKDEVKKLKQQCEDLGIPLEGDEDIDTLKMMIDIAEEEGNKSKSKKSDKKEKPAPAKSKSKSKPKDEDEDEDEEEEDSDSDEDEDDPDEDEDSDDEDSDSDEDEDEEDEDSDSDEDEEDEDSDSDEDEDEEDSDEDDEDDEDSDSDDEEDSDEDDEDSDEDDDEEDEDSDSEDEDEDEEEEEVDRIEILVNGKKVKLTDELKNLVLKHLNKSKKNVPDEKGKSKTKPKEEKTEMTNYKKVDGVMEFVEKIQKACKKSEPNMKKSGITFVTGKGKPFMIFNNINKKAAGYLTLNKIPLSVAKKILGKEFKYYENGNTEQAVINGFNVSQYGKLRELIKESFSIASGNEPTLWKAKKK